MFEALKKQDTVQAYVSRFPGNDIVFYGEDWWIDYNIGEVDVPSKVKFQIRVFSVSNKQYLITNKYEKFFFIFSYNYGGVFTPIPDEFKIDPTTMSEKEIFKKIANFTTELSGSNNFSLKRINTVTAILVTDDRRLGRTIEKFKDCSYYQD